VAADRESATASSCSAVYRWLTRKRGAHAEVDEQPVTTMRQSRPAVTPSRSPSSNPKVLFICAERVWRSAATGLRRPGGLAGGRLYISQWPARPFALPVLRCYRSRATGLAEPLHRLKDWMERQHAVLHRGDSGREDGSVMVLYKGITASAARARAAPAPSRQR